jgi:ribosome recycling factor
LFALPIHEQGRALQLRITNATTQRSNRVIKQLKRVGCGYRNRANGFRREDRPAVGH